MYSYQKVFNLHFIVGCKTLFASNFPTILFIHSLHNRRSPAMSYLKNLGNTLFSLPSDNVLVWVLLWSCAILSRAITSEETDILRSAICTGAKTAREIYWVSVDQSKIIPQVPLAGRTACHARTDTHTHTYTHRHTLNDLSEVNKTIK